MKYQNSYLTSTLVTSTLVSTLLFSASSAAIDETESLRQRSQDKSSFTALSFDLSGKSGNSETENFAFGVYHSERKDKHFGFVMASREYAKSNEIKSADSSFLHGRYNYYYEQNKAVEVFTQLNTDEFKSLESRKLVGVALRKELSEKNTLGIGAFKEWEEYDVNGQELDFDQTRLSLYWVASFPISEHAELSNTLYYQPNISEFADWRAYNRLSVKSKLTEKLSLKFGLLVEHDSRPVLDVEETDISYQAGFTYEF